MPLGRVERSVDGRLRSFERRRDAQGGEQNRERRVDGRGVRRLDCRSVLDRAERAAVDSLCGESSVMAHRKCKRRRNLALRVHEREAFAVRLLLLEPSQRRAPVCRRVLDDDLELVALLESVGERDGERRAEVRVTLRGKGEGEVCVGRRGDVAALDGEVGRVEDELVLSLGSNPCQQLLVLAERNRRTTPSFSALSECLTCPRMIRCCQSTVHSRSRDVVRMSW